MALAPESARLDGRRALVTDAAAGNGRACARLADGSLEP